MPTYEFYCLSCKWTFEKVLSILAVRERKEMRCDHCKGRVSQIISGGAAIRVKGGTQCFYTSDRAERNWTGSSEQRKELASQRHELKRRNTKAFFKDGKLKPFWHTDLDSKPIYISNTKQYRSELRKRNLANPSIGEYGKCH